MTEKYIPYNVDGRGYKIPESKASDFEKMYPSATIRMSVEDRTYNIPSSQRQAFVDKYPSASYLYEENENKPEAPVSLEDDADVEMTRRDKRKARREEKANDDNVTLREAVKNSYGVNRANFAKYAVDLANIALKARSLSPEYNISDIVEGITGKSAYDPDSPLNKASEALAEEVEKRSTMADPTKGEKGYGELLKELQFGKIAKKTIGQTIQSAPMMAAASSGLGSLVLGAGMSASEFENLRREQPEVDEWKNLLYAVGTTATEFAVEKLGGPLKNLFSKGAKNLTKEAAQEIIEEVTKEGEKSIAERILKGILKEGAEEGGEEVITQVANDALGSALDKLDGKQDFGYAAQWEKFKEENPDATKGEFAKIKAKELWEAFLGGGFAGGLMSSLTTPISEFGRKQAADGIQKSKDFGEALDYGDMYDVESDMADASAELEQSFVNEKGEAILTPDFLGSLSSDEAFILSEREELSDAQRTALYNYAQNKAVQEGLEKKLDERTIAQINKSRELINSATNEDGTIIAGNAEGRNVYVVDAQLKNGVVTTPYGSSPVIVIDANTGEKFYVPSDDIKDGRSIDSKALMGDIEQTLLNADNQAREVARNTMSPRAKIKAIQPFAGKKILVDLGNGATEVYVQQIDANGNVLIKGKKGDLGGQTFLTLNGSTFYDSIYRDNDGNPVVTEAGPEVEEQVDEAPEAGVTEADDFRDYVGPILINGVPVNVEVTQQDDASDTIVYTYVDENGVTRRGTSSISEFKNAIVKQQPEAEVTPEPAPIDETPVTPEPAPEVDETPIEDIPEVGETPAPQPIDWDALFESDKEAFFSELHNYFGDDAVIMLEDFIEATQKELDELNKAKVKGFNEIAANRQAKAIVQAKLDVLNDMMQRLTPAPVAETPVEEAPVETPAPVAETPVGETPTEPTPEPEPQPTPEPQPEPQPEPEPEPAPIPEPAPVAPKPVANPIDEAKKREQSLADLLARNDVDPAEKRDRAFDAGKAVADLFATREEYDAYEQSESAVDLGKYYDDFQRGVEESFANRGQNTGENGGESAPLGEQPKGEEDVENGGNQTGEGGEDVQGHSDDSGSGGSDNGGTQTDGEGDAEEAQVRRGEDSPEGGLEDKYPARKGDVDAQTLKDTFGFRRVKIPAEWTHVYNAIYDTFMEMAKMLGISPKSISHGGTLSFDKIADNVKESTKGQYGPNSDWFPTNGNIYLRDHALSSMLHEWWHSLDNMLEWWEGGESKFTSTVGKSKTRARQEVHRAIANVIKAIRQSGHIARIESMWLRGESYFKEKKEQTARAFEEYILGKFAEKGIIVENVSQSNWSTQPNAKEMAVIAPAFDKLFEVLKEKEGKTPGTSVLYQISKVMEENTEVKKELGEQVAEWIKQGGNFVVTDAETIAKALEEEGIHKLDGTDGIVYGFVKDGVVYLDPTIINPNTAIHEYTHLWDNALMQLNPELWEKGKALMKQTPLWDEVINDPNYADIKDNEDLVASEVHSRLVGKDGAARLEMLEQEAREKGLTKNAKQISILGRLREWLNEATKWLKDAFTKWEKSELDKLSIDDFLNMPLRDLANFRQLPKEGIITNANGDVIADNKGKGKIQFSISTWEQGGRDYLVNWLNNDKTLDADEKADIVARMDEFYENAKKYTDVYVPFGNWSDAAVKYDSEGNPIMSVIKANGDYAMNLDFSLVCKKRRPLNRLLRTLINRNAFGTYSLKERELAEINWILQEHGFEVACALCFVDAKRYRVTGVADVFAALYNKMVKALAPEGVEIAHFNYNGNPNVAAVENGLDTMADDQLNWEAFDKLASKFGPNTVEGKVARFLRENPSQRKLVDSTDFIEADGFEAVKTNNPALLSLYNSKKGQAGPKASFGDVQYLNDILKHDKKFDIEKAYAVGGVRLQSFSDFVAHMYFDYMQLFAELAAKRLPAHAYTKEVLFAKIFGLTGMKINMSLVPAVAEDGIAPGLDKDGNYVWADPIKDKSGNIIQQGQTFPYDEAAAIQRAEGYSKNCGIIAVGISDEHITKMLNDENIPYIIPYHKSALNAIVARMTNINKYKDYEKDQNTRDSKGAKLAKGTPEFNFNEYLHTHKDATPQQAAQAYLDWCRENNYIPKFSQFAYHPNYYKLLADFNTMDLRTGEYSPQGAVKMDFPTADGPFGDVETLIKQRLQEDADVEEKMDAEMEEVANEVEGMLKRVAEEPKMSARKKAEHLARLADERTAKINEMASKDNSVSLQSNDSDYAQDNNSQLGTSNGEGESAASNSRHKGANVSDRKFSGIAERYTGDTLRRAEKVIGRIRESLEKHRAEAERLIAIYPEAESLINSLFNDVLYRSAGVVAFNADSFIADAKSFYGDSSKDLVDFFESVKKEQLTIREEEVADTLNEIGIKQNETVSYNTLKDIFNSFSPKQYESVLFDRLIDLAERLGVKVMFTTSHNGGPIKIDGLYDSEQNYIAMDASLLTGLNVNNNIDLTNRLVHELLHSVTSKGFALKQLYDSFVKSGQKSLAQAIKLPQNIYDALETLEGVYESIKEDSAVTGEYGIENKKEMIAELSNPVFRKKLSDKGLWERVKGAIVKLLSYINGEAKASTLSVIEDAVDKLLSELQTGSADHLYSLFIKNHSIKGDHIDFAKSHITPEMDAEYLAAVEAGDMETAQRMVLEAAKIAMPNTKVVDENGNPKIVYHQTNHKVYINRETGQNWDDVDWKEKMEWDERDDWEDYWEEQDFYTFSRVNARTTNEFDGFFFAPEYDEYHEYGDRTIAAFLNIKNPASRDDYNIDASKNDAGRNERIRLQEAGFDGVVRMDGDDVDEYIAFEPNQIKSADPVIHDDNGNVIPLSERFNPENPDIRYRKGARQNEAVGRLVGTARSIAIENAVNEEAAKLGVKVTYKTREEMPVGHKNDKGYYNTKTGEIVVCTENASSISDAIQTILHEAVAHKGLRALMGDRFNEFINRVYESLDDATKAKVDALADTKYKGNKAVAMEEYMASLAETMDFENKSVWEKIKEAFEDIINSILGRNDIKIGDNELRYILRASYNHMSNPRTMDTLEGWAKDKMMREEYKVNEAQPELMSRTGIDPTEASRETARKTYDKVVTQQWQEFQRQFQDAMQPVRIAIDAIQQETGNIPIEDYENYLLIQNQSSSRSRNEINLFERQYYNPIYKQVSKIIDMMLEARHYDKTDETKRAEAYAELKQYLIAKHGLERNLYYQTHNLRKLKPHEKAREMKAAKDAYDEAVRIINEDANLSDTERQLELYKAKDVYDAAVIEIQTREVPDLRDYSGLTSLFGLSPKKFKEAEQEAQILVDEFEIMLGSTNDAESEVVKALWEKINAATSRTLRHSYESGLISRAQYEEIKDMFKFYIPLRGFDETTAEDVYSYARFEGNSFNPAVQKAGGRTSVADDPIAFIMNMAESEIAQGNKNRAKQALYNYLLNRTNKDAEGNDEQNSLMQVESVWYEVKEDQNGQTVHVIATPDRAAGETYEDFENRMLALEQENKAYKSKRGKVSVGMRFQKPKNMDAHYIYLKVNGVEKAIYVNGDPKAADAVNGKFASQPTKAEKMAKDVNRFVSSMFTNYSLEFTVRNFLRDLVYSRINIGVKEDGEYGIQFRKNFWRNNPIQMLRMLVAYRAGEFDNADLTEDQAAFVEFMNNGGQTGYTLINSVENHKKDLERAIKRMQKGLVKGGIKDSTAFKYTLGGIELLNEASELTTRFAAFKTSRDLGRPINQSISDAKEISVNFNTKGAQDGNSVMGVIARYFGAAKYFFNASVQGVQNIGAMAQKNAGKFGATVGTMIAFGAMWPMINTAILSLITGDDEDDEYWKIPEYDRQNNLCIVLGNGRYIKIALPIGFREMFGIGDMAMASITGKTPRDPMQWGKDFANKIANVALPINPLEGTVNGLSLIESAEDMLIPDMAQFILQNRSNKDWKGAPIQKEYTYNQDDPQWTKAFSGNPAWLTGFCKWMNENFVADGVGVDWSPEKIDNTLSNVFGGTYSLVKKIGRTVSSAINAIKGEDEFSISSIPVVGVFTGKVGEDSFVTSTYWNMEDYYSKRLPTIKRTAASFGYTLDEVFARTDDGEARAGEHQPAMSKIYNRKNFDFMQEWYLGHKGEGDEENLGLDQIKTQIERYKKAVNKDEFDLDAKEMLAEYEMMLEAKRRDLVNDLLELD